MVVRFVQVRRTPCCQVSRCIVLTTEKVETFVTISRFSPSVGLGRGKVYFALAFALYRCALTKVGTREETPRSKVDTSSTAARRTHA